MLEIRIDPDNPVPIYQQIVHLVKHQVAAGRLKPGEQLPTVRELASNLRVNPNTVARAYDELDKDHVITTQQGRGTYVRERPDQDHLTSMRQEHLGTLLNGMLTRALSLGYTEQEIRDAFEDQLARWSSTRKT